MAQELPVPGLETEDIEMPGNPEIDSLADWSASIGAYPDLLFEGRDYWKRQKELFTEDAEQDVSDSMFDRLNAEQRQLFDLFTQHLEQTLDNHAL